MDIEPSIIAAIRSQHENLRGARALLVAISGIDAAGKGFVAQRLAAELRNGGLNTVVINADSWLNLPQIRFRQPDDPSHFYEHAFRFDELFGHLIEPLVQNRGIQLSANLTEETATHYREHFYDFRDVDVVLLEGIFLLKRAHRERFDLALWVECSFETALGRAERRGQEGLPPAQTRRAFESLYFPAQAIHFSRDRPAEAAHFVISNESVLSV